MLITVCCVFGCVKLREWTIMTRMMREQGMDMMTGMNQGMMAITGIHGATSEFTVICSRGDWRVVSWRVVTWRVVTWRMPWRDATWREVMWRDAWRDLAWRGVAWCDCLQTKVVFMFTGPGPVTGQTKGVFMFNWSALVQTRGVFMFTGPNNCSDTGRVYVDRTQ